MCKSVWGEIFYVAHVAAFQLDCPIFSSVARISDRFPDYQLGLSDFPNKIPLFRAKVIPLAYVAGREQATEIRATQLKNDNVRNVKAFPTGAVFAP